MASATLRRYSVLQDPAGQKPGRFRFCLLVAGIICVIGGCIGVGYLAIRPEGGVTVKQLEAEVKEKLPIGSSRKQVYAWFASHGLYPADIVEISSGRSVGLGTSMPNNTFLEMAEIRISVYFDSADRLERVHIYRFVYSL